VTRVDRAILVVLCAAFLLVVGAVAWPGVSPQLIPADVGVPGASSSPAGAKANVAPDTYREGILGRASSASPFGARSQADRDLVALVFAGLIRMGPNGTVLPDLATDWAIDSTGATYTFHLRSNARWQDGAAVTSADVAFTIHTLQDPGYTGPGSTSWREVAVDTPDPRTVRFTIAHPLGGFLPAFTQPIAPAHLLDGVAPEDLPSHPFGLQPVGAGPFRLVSFNAGQAVLERSRYAYETLPAPDASDSPGASAGAASASAASASAGSASPSAGATGVPIRRIELHFFATPEAASAAFEAGHLDAVDGLPPAAATALAALPGVHVVPDQLTTVSSIVLNLRPGQAELRDVRVRRALLAAIDRQSLVSDVLAGFGSLADGLIPSSSGVAVPTANPDQPYSRGAAVKLLESAGWTRVNERWRAPKAKRAFHLDLVSPDAASSPTLATFAERIAEGWQALGIDAKAVPMPPASLVGQRLQAGNFQAALVDLAVGHDPDLYPLFASSQVLGGGTNLSGIQDPALDRLLISAREAVDDAARRKAYGALEAYLSTNQIVLPLAVQDDPLVVGPRLIGPAPRTLADASERFGDVLSWRLANGR
jgi:peptide/nickel transport system substrate-binding protein